ncbi:hypothetical protein DVH24_004736, partial [Malus domestica]
FKAASNITPDNSPWVPDKPLVDNIVPLTLDTRTSPKRTCGLAMCLVNHIGGLPVQINPSVATRLGFRIDNSYIELVAIANGRICYTKGLAYNVSVNFQGYAPIIHHEVDILSPCESEHLSVWDALGMLQSLDWRQF